MDRSPSQSQRSRRTSALGLASLLSTAIAIGPVGGAVSASTDPPATYTITPNSGASVGNEPVTISGPNIDEVEFVFFNRSIANTQPIGQNEIQVYTPGGLPGNVEVRLRFVGEDDIIVPGGFTYVERSAPGPSGQPGSGTTIVEPPLAETGATTAGLGMLAAALVVTGALALLVVTRRRRPTRSIG